MTALALSSLLSIFWPLSEPDGILTEGLQSDMGVFGFVWIFCLLFWFVQDLLKVLLYKWMYSVNFNDISTSAVVELPDSAKKVVETYEEAFATGANTHH